MSWGPDGAKEQTAEENVKQLPWNQFHMPEKWVLSAEREQGREKDRIV